MLNEIKSWVPRPKPRPKSLSDVEQCIDFTQDLGNWGGGGSSLDLGILPSRDILLALRQLKFACIVRSTVINND